MLKELFLTVFIFSSSIIAFAQQKLVVGDKAPIINYQKSYPNNYVIPSGKAIVLDFWATWCAPCVAGLLETNDFVDKYSSNFDFIAITDTTSRNILNFKKIRKFKHVFLVDETSGTFKTFGVESIPYAFLIDKNGIIQWVGHGRDINEEMLNEFLTTGHIKVKAINSEVSSFSLDAYNKIQKIRVLGNYKFSISEIQKENLSHSFYLKFDSDTFHYLANYYTIKSIISSLYNNQDNRIIYLSGNHLLFLKRLTVDLEATNVDPEKIKFQIIKDIGRRYGFNAYIKDIDTTIWKLIVVDSKKLALKKTVLTSKNNSSSSKYTNYIKDNGYMIALNSTLSELAESIERQFKVFVLKPFDNALGYDFIKIGSPQFTEFRKDLERQCGLRLQKQKQKIPFLIIN